MTVIGRRILEIGVFSLILVLIISVSCVMSKACPSGFLPVSESSSIVGGDSANAIPHDGNIKDVNKEVQTKYPKDNNSTTNASTTSNTTEVITSTTKPPFSVIIYTANNHFGRSTVLTFPNSECQNLPELMQNRVNSINTRGECVILCDGLDCGGWCVKFAPGTPAHHRFRKLRFQNRAESIISCD